MCVCVCVCVCGVWFVVWCGVCVCVCVLCVWYVVCVRVCVCVCVCVEKSSPSIVCQLLHILEYPYIIQCSGIHWYWLGMVWSLSALLK